MKTDHLEKLVQRLSEAFHKSAKSTGTNTKNMLLPPASNREIEAFEEKNFQFPESYREFLRLHNGWKKFSNDYTLIGVSGSHTEQALRDFRKLDKAFMDQWKAAGRSVDPEYIKSYQSKTSDGETLDEAHLYLPSLAKFGTNFTKGYFAFNVSLSQDKDPEVLSVYFLKKIIRRDANFVAFLERTLETYAVRGY